MRDVGHEDLDYGRMRLLRLRVVLVAFLKRWGIGLAMVFLVFAAGSNAPLRIAAGLAATLLLPLLLAAEHGWWIVPVGVGYAVVGALPVVVSRSLWWPPTWAMAERALPLAPASLRRSDRGIAAVILAPLQCLLMLGLVGLVLVEGAGRAVVLVAGGWLVSAMASSWLAVAWMSAVRGRRSTNAARDRTSHPTSAHVARSPRTLDFRVAAIVLPLWRGRARRSTAVLVAGLVVTSATATASAWSALTFEWTLAISAFCALAVTSVSSDATRRELQPLWLAHRALPLSHHACERWRNGLVLLPTIAGVVASDVTAFTVSAVRIVPFVAYVVSVVGGCVAEALLPRTSDTQVRAARWMLTLAVCTACASEVT